LRQKDELAFAASRDMKVLAPCDAALLAREVGATHGRKNVLF
jgi:hypothetical protein